MNLKQENRHIVDVLFVLALFCVFAVSALVLVIIGAGVYQKTVNDMNLNYSSRTAFSYVTEKIRQNDTASSISIGSILGEDAIILTQEIEGEEYSTYLYEYEGCLMELFLRKGSDTGSNALKAGRKILELDAFELVHLEGPLYRFTIYTRNQQTLTVYISTQSN